MVVYLSKVPASLLQIHRLVLKFIGVLLGRFICGHPLEVENV